MEVLVMIGMIVFGVYVVKEIKSIKKRVGNAESFSREMVRVAGDNPKKVLENVSSYLHLKHTHYNGSVLTSVLPKNKTDQIDWDAYATQLQSEVNDLIRKKEAESEMDDIPYPDIPLK